MPSWSYVPPRKAAAATSGSHLGAWPPADPGMLPAGGGCRTGVGFRSVAPHAYEEPVVRWHLQISRRAVDSV